MGALRNLTKSELAKLKAAPGNDAYLVEGDEGDWWVYSQALDAYLFTGMAVGEVADEHVAEWLYATEPQLEPDALWDFC